MEGKEGRNGREGRKRKGKKKEKEWNGRPETIKLQENIDSKLYVSLSNFSWLGRNLSLLARATKAR